MLRDPRCLLFLVQSFCIAPLDVLKIRLQLQVHPLAGSETQLRNYRRVSSGAFSTFKSILLEEGVTVRIFHPMLLFAVNDPRYVGFLER